MRGLRCVLTARTRDRVDPRGSGLPFQRHAAGRVHHRIQERARQQGLFQLGQEALYESPA